MKQPNKMSTLLRKPDFYAIAFLPTEPGNTSVEMIPVWSLEDAIRLQDERYYILKQVRIKTLYETKEV